MKRDIASVLSDLLPKEREILMRRFGLESDDSETLSEVGAACGNICRERVRQLEFKALEKIRLTNPHLKKYLDDF